MSSVDDRIVNMQFNNKQFTQGAAESQRSLEGLDRTLANTGKGTGLTTMGTAVDGIKTKFSALQIAGTAALATIASKATSVGLNLLKSLTVDPILQGFSEYQTNLNSIQTVMSNTGKSVDTVNGYMQKLNTYSDQTIYNFSEMAKNIGTFTAAGVDLKTATSSIQGIANLAALSGSNSQQASTAMYQLSQAISAGRVGLQDWNSVVNAGMGGKVFQNALAQTATAMGTLNNTAISMVGPMDSLKINGESFRQSISAAAGGESWLTGDVLTKTLSLLDGRFASASYAARGFTEEVIAQKIEAQKAKLAEEGYTDAQIKGIVDVANRAYEAATIVKTFPQLMQVVKESIGSVFSNSFGLILGNFNQSKKLWTHVGSFIIGPSGIITKMGNAVTGSLRQWVNQGGRTAVIKGFSRLARNLMHIFGTITSAFRDVFPAGSSHGLSDLSKGFNQFTKILYAHRATLDNIKSIFSGVFAVMHIGYTIVKGIGAAFIAFFKAMSSGADSSQSGILSLLASVGEVLVKLDQWVTGGGKLVDSMEKVGAVAGSFVEPFVSGFGLIVKTIATLVSGGGINGVTRQLIMFGQSSSGIAELVRNNVGRIHDVLMNLRDPVDAAVGAFNSLKQSMSGLSGGDIQSTFKNIAGAIGDVVGAGVEIGSQIVAGLIQGLGSAGPQLLSAIGNIATSIIEAFKSFMGIHSPSTEMIDPGFNVIQGIVQGIYKGLSIIGQVMAKVGEVFKNAFTQLFGDFDALDFATLINSIISGGFLLALTNILNSVGSAGFFAGFSNFFDQLSNSLQAFQQNLKAQALLAIGTALALLVGSIVLLALLDPTQIAYGLGTIGILMGLLNASFALLSKTTKGGVTLALISGAMTEMATAIVILSGAIALLGNLKPETLSQGLAAIAIAMALMIGSMRALSGISGSLVAAGAAMVLMAVALQALAGAVFLFANLDPDKLGQGLSAMAIGLALMVGALRALSGTGPSIAAAGVALVLVATAMQAMVLAVLGFGKINPKAFNQGMVGMALSIALLTGSLLVLGAMGPEVLLAGAGIALMAHALSTFAGVVGTLGAMKPDELKQGLIAVAIGLGILIAAAALAEYVAPGLLALGITVALLGAGVALAGAGMLAFATALTILTVVGVAAIALMVIAIEAFIALLPSIAIQFAAAFVSFIETVADAAPRVRAAVGKIFEAIIGAITDAIDPIEALMLRLIDAAFDVIEVTIPRWIELGLTIIDKFIAGLAKHVPNVVESIGDMIVDLIRAFGDRVDDFIDAGADVIVAFLRGIANAGAEITDAAGQAIVDLLTAIDNAIIRYADRIRELGGQIAYDLLDGLSGGLISRGGSVLQHAWDSIPKPSLNPLDLLGRKGAGSGSLIPAAAAAVAAANALVATDVSQGDPTVAAAQRAALQASNAATVKNAIAQAADKAAKDAEKKANAKGAGKGAKDKAQKLRNAADKAAAQAQAAEDRANKAADGLSDAISFRDADVHGKADILADDAAGLAEQANNFLARANAEAKKAKEDKTLTANERKKLLAAAEADAKKAAQFAEAARKSQEQANAYYAQEVQDRLDQLAADEAADAQARADEEAYNSADNAGKAAIMKARADADQAKAVAAKALALSLREQAKAAAAAGNYAAAMQFLDDAEAASQTAQEAADRAEQELEQATQLATQPGTSSGGMSGTIQPSKSALEDAARAQDRYSESLAQAEALAGAAQGAVNYEQNIYSPTPLSPIDVYRHTRNLVVTPAVTKSS